MSSKIQKLSILAGLLAAAILEPPPRPVPSSTSAAAVRFSYTCNVRTDMLANATGVQNLYYSGDYLAPTGYYQYGTAFAMWHFQTSGTNVTFGNDLALSGRVTNMGWGNATVYVMTSTSGDTGNLTNNSMTGWDAFYSHQWAMGDATFSAASLNGAGAGYSDFYVAFYVQYPTWDQGQNYLLEFFRSADGPQAPFVLSGSLITAPVPEPASLALLGLAAGAVLYRRRR